MLDKLLRLLQDSPRQGKVSRVDGASVWVTVGGKAISAKRQAGDATSYRDGDTVRLAGDLITARVVRRSVRRYIV